MKKWMIWGLAALLAVSCGVASDMPALPFSVAHRGCWLMDGNEFYINENCPAGVRMAAQYGYPAIECDVKYTRDSVMVVMHDATINRTMRNAADYSVIGTPVRVSDVTFGELRSKYVLASTDPALRVPIPTLEELLDACLEYGVMPMLHSSVVESYSLAHRKLGDGFIAFDGSQASLSRARDISSCLILLDPGRDAASRTVVRLQEIGAPCGMSTMKHDMLDAGYIRTVKEAGFEVQASIFPSPHEQRAAADGATIQLTDFWWYQTGGRRPAARFRKRSVSLPEGESLSWSPEAPEYAAVTLVLDFSGTLKVTVAGREYVLSGDRNGMPSVLGARLYKARPGIRVQALSDTEIRSVKAALYDCGDR